MKWLLVGALAPFAVACSDEGDAGTTGGAGGGGQDSGRADGTATGGGGAAAGSGGSAGSAAGSGGTSGTADSGPSADATGGSAGSADLDATDAGVWPPVCTTAQYNHVSSFGSILDGWGIANVGTDFRLLPSIDPDSGAMTGAMLALDQAVGSPDNGSVRLTIPFTSPGQLLLFAQNYPSGLNMSGTTVSAQIRLTTGLNTGPLYAGRAYIVLKTGVGYTYVAGPRINLDRSAGFQTLTFDVDSPSASVDPLYNPCEVREIDIIIETPGDNVVELPDASAFTTAVVHIDTIAITPKGGSDAGVVDSSAPRADASDAGATGNVDARTTTADAADASAAADATGQ